MAVNQTNQSDLIPRYDPSDIFKIALVATGSWGDNIIQTFQLKPLKTKYPNSIIDVHTSDRFASAFYNNPYVSNIYEHHAADKSNALNLVHVIPPLLQNSGYDLILSRHPMAYQPWSTSKHPELGENFMYVYAGQMDDLGLEYEVPLQSVLQLTASEVSNVRKFVERVPDFDTSLNILMEVQAESGQTFWDPNWTIRVSELFLTEPNAKLYISGRNLTSDILHLNNTYPGRVYFVGTLSIRECAELFNYCQIFQSISSGLSNACNTNWCKKDIIWLEVINSRAVSSEPMRKEGKLFWMDNNIDNYINKLKSYLAA
jgi:hypothetical protein